MGSKALKKNDFRRSITTSAGRHPIFTAHRNRTSISAVDHYSKSALTPISRFKKFQKVRDRNLRKTILKKSVNSSARKSMTMEAVATTSEAIASEISKPSPKKAEKRSESPSPVKLENGSLNGISEDSPILENGHHNGLKDEEQPVRRSLRKKVEVKEVETVELHNAETEEESEEELEDERPLKVLRMSQGPPPSPSRISKGRQESSSRSVSRDRDDWALFSTVQDVKISGRQPLRQGSVKRKADMDPLPDENVPKRMAFTPSVSSPGWRFFSSPFTRFWPNRVPCEDDSLLVNLSTDSAASEEPSSFELPSLLEETETTQEEEEETEIEKPTVEPPSTRPWQCSIM